LSAQRNIWTVTTKISSFRRYDHIGILPDRRAVFLSNSNTARNTAQNLQLHNKRLNNEDPIRDNRENRQYHLVLLVSMSRGYLPNTRIA